jgi:hypothetical protein
VAQVSLDNIRIRLAGPRVVLSCDDGASLHAIFDSLAEDGAIGLSRPVKVRGRWVASFEDPVGRCGVETQALRTIVSGPSRDLALARAQEFLHRGAVVTGGPFQRDGCWRMILALPERANRI